MLRKNDSVVTTKNQKLSSNLIVRYLKNNLGILLALFFLCLVLSLATNSFFDGKNILTVLRQICINSLLAIGMTFVLIIGGIDLTVGSVVGASGVACVMLMEAGTGLIPAILLALLFGAIIGFINGMIIATTGMPAFIVTLSMMGVIRGLAYIITDGRSVSSNDKVFTSMGNGYLLGIPNPIYILVIIMIIVSVVLYKTKFGRRMYAIGGNPMAAKFTGIKIKSITVKVYVISALLASLAGIILASRMFSGQPTAGQGYESDAIAAAVLGGTSFTGGIGTIGGTFIGALVIGVLSNGLNLVHIPSYVQMVIKGIVIIIAVGFDIIKNKNNGK
ncbi:MAG: ABC transporter permease [Ruminiclostridium sp.]